MKNPDPKIMVSTLADHLKIIVERAYDEGRKAERGGLADLTQTKAAIDNCMDALAAEFRLAVQNQALEIVDHCLRAQEAEQCG